MSTPPTKKIRLTEEHGCPSIKEHTDVIIASDNCYLTSLPSELLVVILSFLSARDKLRVRLTCHRLYFFLTDSLFWKTISWKDYFPHRDEKAVKCALQFGTTSLTKLSIFGCGSLALSKLKSLLVSCTQLNYVILIGFTLSQRQIALLLSTSTKNLDVEIIEKESKQILEILAHSQLVSVVLHFSQTPNITMITKVWSDAGYSPSDVKICVRHNSEIDVADIHFALQSILSSLPHCNHKARLAVGYSSIHTYIRQATMQPFCEISNKESVFGFSQLSCEKLGLSTCMLSLTRSNVMTDSYTAATVHKLRQPFLNKVVPQDIALIENITELCLTNLQEISSNHLTIIAVNCSHLVRLNIQKCTRSLSDLSGLSSVASHCQNLQGINLDGIHYHKVESIVKLWDILAQVKLLSHLRFCYCLVCLSRTVSQRHATSSVTPNVQSRVSRFIPQLSDTEQLQAVIRKLTNVDTLELTCHVPGVQDDSITFQTLSCFTSVQSLSLEGCPQKVAILKEIFPVLRLSRILINTGAQYHPLNMPSTPACYQNLQKIAIIAHRNPQIVVVNESITSALTHAKKLTHIYISACFDSPDAITILINESPHLMELFLTGKMQCTSFKTRSSVKKLEKLVKTELTKKKVRHQVALYLQTWPSNVSQAISEAVSLTELSSLWIT